MSLLVSNDLDHVPYFTTGNYPSAGGFLERGDVNRQKWIYYDRLGMVISDWSLSGAHASGEEWCRFDPLVLDNNGSLFDAVPEPGLIGGVNQDSIILGEWDKPNNTQRTYVHQGLSTARVFNEVNPLALNQPLNEDAFPNLYANESRVVGSTIQGYYGTVTNGHRVVFETWGKMLFSNVQIRDGGIDKRGVMALVDLTTGLATLVPTTQSYGFSGVGYTHDQVGPTLFDQQVQFAEIQFVADDDSKLVQPKGLLYMWPVNTTQDPNNTANFRSWVKVMEWNPTGLAGSPNRVHLRVRLLSAVDLIKATPGSSNGVHETGTTVVFAHRYHPGSNRLFLTSRQTSGAALNTGEAKFIYYSSTPALDFITEPSPQEIVATGKTLAFNVEAFGTLVEPVGGVDLQFAMTRRSTVGEVLTTGAPGSTSTLANTVDPTQLEVSPVTVYEDGVPLTLTTHYTVNRGASQITFVAPKPLAGGEVYTADYRHFGTGASPPHGDLLSTFGTTDADGVATTRVRYDEEDPVKDRWDRLEATVV